MEQALPEKNDHKKSPRAFEQSREKEESTGTCEAKKDFPKLTTPPNCTSLPNGR